MTGLDGKFTMFHILKSISGFLAAFTLVPGVANATVFNVNIFAEVSGTDTVAACGPGQVFPYCPQESLPYQNTIARYLGPIDLLLGDNPFSYGGYYSTGLITGTINNTNGVLTGRDLTYAYASCSGPCPGDHIYATAQSFQVTGGVPEPATWAMLLVGIGAVGWTLRRRAPRLAHGAMVET